MGPWARLEAAMESPHPLLGILPRFSSLSTLLMCVCIHRRELQTDVLPRGSCLLNNILTYLSSLGVLRMKGL